MNNTDDPTRPLYSPDSFELKALIGVDFLILLIPFFWTTFCGIQWSKAKFSKTSQQCLQFWAWLVFLIAQILYTCIPLTILTCKYPYVELIPSPVLSQCTTLYWVRIGNMLCAIGGALFNISCMRRFEPTYVAFAKRWVQFFHRAMYIGSGLVGLLIVVSSILILKREIYFNSVVDDTTSEDSTFENQALPLGGFYFGFSVLLTALMGIRFVLKTLRSIRQEIQSFRNQNEYAYDIWYLRLTLLSLVLNIFSMLVYGLASYGMLPGWWNLPLLVRLEIVVFSIFLYLSCMMTAMYAFSKAIDSNRYRIAHSKLSTTWVERDIAHASLD